MSCLKPEGATPGGLNEAGLDFNPAEIMEPRKPGTIAPDLKNGGRVKNNDVAPEGVYLPDYNILTPHMRSPEYVQMSTAAAITLGVATGRWLEAAT